MRRSCSSEQTVSVGFQMKTVHGDALLCSVVLFFAELRLAVGSAGIDIKFPDFSIDDHLTLFGDAEYNPARRSHTLNAHATKQTTGSCGALIYEHGVRLQEVATGRVASFSTSFSFSFTTYGEPTDASENPTAGTALAFIMFGRIIRSPLSKQISALQVSNFNSCMGGRDEIGNFGRGGFGVIFNTEYAPYRGVLSNNYIEIMKHYDYELGNPAYTHNLCGQNRTHCSYFSNGTVFTAWIDFTSSSTTLEVRLANGSQPNVTKPLQPLLRIPNYNLAKELGDEVHLTYWGGSGVNHFEEHELLSWSFFSSGIPESIDSSFLGRLLQLSKTRTDVGIMIGVFGSVATLVMLWTISLLTRSFREHYGYRSIRDPAAGSHLFSYAELRRATSNFDESNLLGTGGSGSVHRGTLEGGNWIAVKQINFSESEQAKAVFQAEVSSLGQIRHRNVVRLQGSCQEKGRLLLIYDYLPNGSLDAWLHKKSDRLQLSLEIRHCILEGVGAALEYLHEDCPKCILHRDIKSSNVLLDADFKAQLGDFGLARLMDHHKPDKTTLAAGTLGYMAPEIPYTNKATKESDVFSFGILVLEVVCGRRPLDMETMNPKDLVLLYSVWRAHEVGALISVVDPRLFETLNPLSLFLECHGVSPSNVATSTVVDVDIEVQKLTAINLLRLGLLCCLPNPKARPPMAQVNGILQEIGHIVRNLSTVTSVSMPLLPSTKPLGLYHSLEFSQVAVMAGGKEDDQRVRGSSVLHRSRFEA